ncbi:MAG: hypothetical protein ACON35_02845 [Candidatus Marinamargulisbacteria bacterium]
MKKLALLIACLSVIGHAQTKKVTDLPDISIIGNMIATSTETNKSMDVSEIEFSFQHYLYPSVKADVFVGLHKESNGQRKIELEEGYVTFLDTFSVLAPNLGLPSGLGTIVGKKLIGIGKINALHPEQWEFTDRPLAIKQFFGQDHGLSAEGIQFSYLLPVPFFSQIEWGYWTPSAHEEVAGQSHGIEYENRLISTRLWNSFAISRNQELQLGFNYLQGNPSASSKNDKQTLMGTDITFNQAIGDQLLKLQGEIYRVEYGEEGEAAEKQSGSYVSATYDITKAIQAGIRYDQLGKHGDEGQEIKQLAYMLTRQLTETSKFRLQLNSGENTENTVYAQFIFGMGPHSHVLQ